jgi:hypothetical protein
MTWGVTIPMRDGVKLNATLYLPAGEIGPAPVIFTLTPYIGQTYHDFAIYFAEHGFPFLTVDVRGRGNSQGDFKPNINEGKDGHDVVEWIARQSYCDGQVAMWGGSYSGLNQWTTAREFPPHLAAIAPVASPFIGVDFPIRRNIMSSYVMRWLTLVAGRAAQDQIFWNQDSFWAARFRKWFESGAAFKNLDVQLGMPSDIFQEWTDHPRRDEYWDKYNPGPVDYANMSVPILSITGIYDGDQLGALEHYRLHQTHAKPADAARHHLVIGPWDHPGTRSPQLKFAGVEVGLESLLDLRRLHLEWYDWTLRGGPKPEFLQKQVAYYVMAADKWRFADNLDDISSGWRTLFLNAAVNPTDVFASGILSDTRVADDGTDSYAHDPLDVSQAALESLTDPEDRSEQRLVYARHGRQLVYQTLPFEEDVEISGFFKLTAWIAIDQPDTDFHAAIYDIGLDGSSVLMCDDMIRARYRTGLRDEHLIDTQEPLQYDFDAFTFVSRLIRAGHRLRLVIGPIHSIFSQKNYNSGGVVAEESAQQARVVTIRLYRDELRPSALFVPIASSARTVDSRATTDATQVLREDSARV